MKTCYAMHAESSYKSQVCIGASEILFKKNFNLFITIVIRETVKF